MNVKRSKVSKFNIGDQVTLNYINHLEKRTVIFSIERVPNKFIPSFSLREVNPINDTPRYKEELVDYITKINQTPLIMISLKDSESILKTLKENDTCTLVLTTNNNYTTKSTYYLERKSEDSNSVHFNNDKDNEESRVKISYLKDKLPRRVKSHLKSKVLEGYNIKLDIEKDKIYINVNN